MAHTQQLVCEEEVAEGAVRDRCAPLSQHAQLGILQAHAVRHDAALSQQPRSVEDESVPAVYLPS